MLFRSHRDLYQKCSGSTKTLSLPGTHGAADQSVVSPCVTEHESDREQKHWDCVIICRYLKSTSDFVAPTTIRRGLCLHDLFSPRIDVVR